MISVLMWAMVIILMAAGLAGVFLPLVPGHVLIFAGALLYATAENFSSITPIVLGVLAAIAIFAYVIDYAASAVGAEWAGATRWGVAGSLIGTVAGFLFFNLPGMLVGMFLGAAAAELCLGGKDLSAALRAGWGSFLGFLGGMMVKFVLALAMIAIFAWAVLV